jgi:hypothetical protein
MTQIDLGHPSIILKILIQSFPNWDFGDLRDELDYCRLNQDGRDDSK